MGKELGGGAAVPFTLVVTLSRSGISCGRNIPLRHPDSLKLPGKVSSQLERIWTVKQIFCLSSVEAKAKYIPQKTKGIGFLQVINFVQGRGAVWPEEGHQALRGEDPERNQSWSATQLGNLSGRIVGSSFPKRANSPPPSIVRIGEDSPDGAGHMPAGKNCFLNLKSIPCHCPDESPGSSSAAALAQSDLGRVCETGLSWGSRVCRDADWSASVGNVSCSGHRLFLLPLPESGQPCRFLLSRIWRPSSWEWGLFLAEVNETKTRSSWETASFHGHWFYGKVGGLWGTTANKGHFLVSLIVSSRGMGRKKEKIKHSVCSLAPGSIICLLLSAFSYWSLKSRGPKQSATDVLM